LLQKRTAQRGAFWHEKVGSLFNDHYFDVLKFYNKYNLTVNIMTVDIMTVDIMTVDNMMVDITTVDITTVDMLGVDMSGHVYIETQHHRKLGRDALGNFPPS
jgi:hypothetical protein